METNQVDTIDLQELFALLWKNVLIIGIITIVFASVMGLYTHYRVNEKFTSETTVRVATVSSGTSISYNDVLTSQKLVKTYSIIAKSRLVLEPVLDEIALKNDLVLTYNQLVPNISVTAISDTDVISIKVTWTDPVLAADFANYVRVSFMKEITTLVKIDTISLIDDAIPNSAPISPNLTLNVLIGFVVGFMLSVGFVLVRAFLDRTIKNEKDVEHYLHVPVLGSIPTLEIK